jgi:hypothetical protein
MSKVEPQRWVGAYNRACQRCYRRHWACCKDEDAEIRGRGGFMSAQDLSKRKACRHSSKARGRERLRKGKKVKAHKRCQRLARMCATHEVLNHKGEVNPYRMRRLGQGRKGSEGRTCGRSLPVGRRARVGEANGSNQPHSVCRETKVDEAQNRRPCRKSERVRP